jgi:hypothetical protein
MQPERTAYVPTARSLLAKRSAARRTVLLATGVTIFLLSLALSSLVALGIRAPLLATRAAIASSSLADSSVVVTASPSSNTTSQDVGVRRVIHSTFSGVPILVVRHRVAASGRNPTRITWTITPDAKSITPSELGPLASGFARVESRIERSESAHSPDAQVTGRGPQTVSDMRSAIAAVDTVLPIPITVLCLAGVLALLLCARLLSATRENETRLLRARGGAVRTIVRADTAEILLPAGIGTVAGAAVAQIILWFSLGVPTNALEVLLAPLAVLLAAVIVSVVSGTAAARAANGAPRSGSGRAGVATALGLAALLVVVTAIATWRFLQYGAPVVGRPQDTAAILAPALMLCTAAMLSLLVFFPVTGWLQRTGSTKLGLLRVFPARTIHRNPRLFAGPIVLLVITVATATVAAGYAATWSGFLGDSARLVTGSDLRATFGGPAIATDASSVLDSSTYAKLPGVRAVVPVLRESATIGDENIAVIGVSVDNARNVIGPGSSVLGVPNLTKALHPSQDPLNGIQLPTAATSLTLHLSATSSSGGPGTVLTTIWLADGLGDLVPVSLPSQTVADQLTRPAAVPLNAPLPRAGPWRIVAIDAEVAATHQLSGFTFGVASISATTPHGDVALGLTHPGPWTAQSAVFNDGASTANVTSAIGFARKTVRGGINTEVRLMPSGAATVPVVVSRAFSQANGLRVGDRIDVSGDWASFSARVSGIVPLVPGVTSQASLMADLRSIDNGWLRSSEQVPALHELWIAGTPDATIAHEVAHAGDGRIATASGSVSRRFVGGAVTGLWLGAAGSAAFAIVTLIASLASVVRRRAREVGVLRALGMAAHDQAHMRRSEIAIVIAFGLVVGALTGVGMLLLTVPTLARSSTPEAPAVLPLLVRFDPLAPALLLAGLVVLSVAIVWRYLAVIVRAAGVAKP